MKMKTARNIITTVFFLIAVVFAQEKSAFEKAREIFSEAENFSVKFYSPVNKTKGVALYSANRGEKISFGDYEILIKADTVFNYNAKVNRLVISMREDEYSNFSLKTVLFDLPERCDIIEENGSVALIPHEPQNENFSRLEIFFYKNNLPEKIIITDLSGHKNEFELSDYKFNENLTAKDFEIPTNDKTKVIDLR